MLNILYFLYKFWKYYFFSLFFLLHHFLSFHVISFFVYYLNTIFHSSSIFSGEFFICGLNKERRPAYGTIARMEKKWQRITRGALCGSHYEIWNPLTRCSSSPTRRCTVRCRLTFRWWKNVFLSLSFSTSFFID